MARAAGGPGFDPIKDVVLDARSLRGVAHPLRLRLLGSLRNDGPQTATQLAARLGESSGATSYHLRMLAAHGFVTEASELGRGRERFWRAVHRSSWFSTPDPDSPDRELGEVYLRTVARNYAGNIDRWVDEMGDWPQEWVAVANLSDLSLRLTTTEAERLADELMTVLVRYREEAREPARRRTGARPAQCPVPALPAARSAGRGAGRPRLVARGGRRAVVNRRPAYGLLIAEAISVTGTRMSVVAVPWFVLETTGSALLTGLTAFVEMGALVATKVLGGPLVDRVGPRAISAGGDLVAGIALGLIPLCHVVGLLSFPTLLVLVGIAGLCRGPADNAKYAAVPQVAAAAGWSNERAGGLADSVNRLGSLVGAPLGGLLVAFTGAPLVIALDAATFVLAAVIVAGLVRIPPVPTAEASDGPRRTRGAGYFADLAAGLRFVAADPLLRAIVAMVFLTNLLDQAITAVLVPVWAAERFGSAAPIGVVFGALGAGALVGSLLVSAYGERLPRWRTYAVAFLLGAVPRIFVLALPLGLPVVGAVALLGGLLIGAINPMLMAAEFERIPAELRARVLGAVGGLAWAGIPLGGLLGGALASWLGATGGLLVVGVAYLLVTLDPLVRRRTWQLMDRPERTPAAVG